MNTDTCMQNKKQPKLSASECLNRSAEALADANEAKEGGKHEKAEKLYTKSEYWLTRYNKLTGGY